MHYPITLPEAISLLESLPGSEPIGRRRALTKFCDCPAASLVELKHGLPPGSFSQSFRAWTCYALGAGANPEWVSAIVEWADHVCDGWLRITVRDTLQALKTIQSGKAPNRASGTFVKESSAL